jgi:serine/threonine protein phosphatase 1
MSKTLGEHKLIMASPETSQSAMRSHGMGAGSTEPRFDEGVAYAIGDIHGRADLLLDVLDRIRTREAGRTGVKASVIFLGDYVDRGPQSRQVIDHILAFSREGACDVVALKGNHEEMMLKFLAGETVGSEWVKLGGAATLRSYGVPAPHPEAPQADFETARALFIQAVSQEHVAFLKGLQLWVERGDYLFVHAGVKPDVPIADQKEKDLLWIRGEFGRCERPSSKVVVYGHTPSSKPRIERWKIGLDTGAYMSGRLTAMRVEGSRQEIIQSA